MAGYSKQLAYKQRKQTITRTHNQRTPKKIQVYVAMSPANKYYKIGQTHDYRKRLNSLNNTSIPLDYSFLFVFENTSLQNKKLEWILHKNFAENRLRPDREFFALNSEELLQIPDIAHKNGYATILNNESELSKIRIIRRLLQKDEFDTEEECLVWYNELLDYLNGTEEHNNNVEFNLAMEAKGEYFSNDEDDTSPWVGEEAIERIICCIGGDADDVEFVFELNPELREKIEFPSGAYDYESEYKLNSYLDYLESCTKNQVENPKRYIEDKGHYYRIQKNLPSGHYVWGSYLDLETALEVRDYLESCDWPLRLLQKADELGWKRGEYLIMCMRRGVRV